MSRYQFFPRTLLMGLGAIALSLSLIACNAEDKTDQNPENNTTETSQPANSVSPASTPKVTWSLITLDELFDAGSGGCGMSLWPAGSKPQEGLMFFNGIDSGSMLMKINGQFVNFEKESGVGEEFYGQHLQQTFSNADLDLIVETDVVLGELGEIESVEISSGTVSLISGESREEIAVVGDAGC